MRSPIEIDRRTVLKGTLAASTVGLGAVSFSGLAAAQGGRSFVIEQGERRFCVEPLRTGETVEDFYNYQRPHSHTSTDIERSDVSNLFLFEGPNGTSLVALHDKANDGHTHGSDSGGGAVDFELSGLPAGASWVVQDDATHDFPSPPSNPPETIRWRWSGHHTDGGALRGGLDGDFSITIDPAFNDAATRSGSRPGRIDEWHVLSGDASNPDRIHIDLGQPVTISRGCLTIDVKPCSDPNAINPDARGVVPVAIAGTDDFDPNDASSGVDVDSLRFGAPDLVKSGGGAGAAHDGHVEDVAPCEGDGTDDLVVHFPTEDTGFDGDEDLGRLEGRTVNGDPLVGTDSVKLVGGGGGSP